MSKGLEHLNIWFELTRAQQRRLSDMGHCFHFLHLVPLDDFKRVTKSKRLIERFKAYKFQPLKLVA